jgi:hypothetical protein
MIALFWTLVVAAATGFATWAAGWLAVPIVAVLTGWLAPRNARSLGSVPLGVALGWALLLLRAARAPGFSRFSARLALLIPASLGTLAGATLVLGFILGLGGVLIGRGLRRPTADS